MGAIAARSKEKDLTALVAYDLCDKVVREMLELGRYG